MKYPSYVNRQIARVIEEKATALSISKLEAAELTKDEFLAEGLLYSAGQAERYIEGVKTQVREAQVAT